MTETTCPYCNAVVPIPASSAAGDRLSCPRCGDSFPYRPADSDGRAQAQPSHSTSRSELAETQTRLSNRAVAAVVLGVMALMAVLGLVMALQTTALRRAHDQHIVKPQEVTVPLLIKIASNLWILGLVCILFDVWRQRSSRAEKEAPRFRWGMAILVGIVLISITVSFVAGPIRKRSTQLPSTADSSALVQSLAPANWQALGYLPADTNAILAIRCDDPAFERARKELFPDGQFAADLFGLKWKDIDHLAFGVKVADFFPPRMILVVRMRQPYDAERIRQDLTATPLTEAGAKDRYRFKLANLRFGDISGISAVLWLMDERTMLVALTPKELEAVPAEPKNGSEHLPVALQTSIQQRVARGATAWLAASSERWHESFVKPWVQTQSGDKAAASLDLLRTVCVWLTLGDEVVLGMATECADDPAAGNLKSQLEDWSRGRWATAKYFQEGPWVSGQAKGRLDDIRQGLQAKPRGD